MTTTRRYLHHALLYLLCLGAGTAVQAAPIEVRVGAYHFPPYAIKPESDQPEGLLLQMLGALNTVQQQYHFELVPTSVTRRYPDLATGRFDLIFFESPAWGWQDTPHQSIDLHIRDAEVYVARKEPGRDQHYFDHLQDKRLAVYSGYHYGFAGFNADPDYLREHFKVDFTYSHDSNLKMVQVGRADVTVVSRSYLALYLSQRPELRDRLLVSQREDQVYEHKALLRPQSPLAPAALEGLLQQLRERGELQPMMQTYQLGYYGEDDRRP